MNQKINAFAMKYLDLYSNPKTTNIQAEETFADECFALGFEMDSGNSFCEKYPKAFNDIRELNRIIEEINAPQFLGTAIFSQWRYITHDDIACSFSYNRKTRQCDIWDNNKPVEDIVPLPVYWLERRLEEKGHLNENESKISY